MPADPERSAGVGGAFRDAAPYLGFGTTLAATMLVFVGGGMWLDRKLGTSPWLLLVGSALGLLGMVYQIYKMNLQTKRQP